MILHSFTSALVFLILTPLSIDATRYSRNQDRNPVFELGCPRSESTVSGLDTILDAVPESIARQIVHASRRGSVSITSRCPSSSSNTNIVDIEEVDEDERSGQSACSSSNLSFRDLQRLGDSALQAWLRESRDISDSVKASLWRVRPRMSAETVAIVQPDGSIDIGAVPREPEVDGDNVNDESNFHHRESDATNLYHDVLPYAPPRYTWRLRLGDTIRAMMILSSGLLLLAVSPIILIIVILNEVATRSFSFAVQSLIKIACLPCLLLLRNYH